MIDVHVHLEKGDYSVEWIKQFVAYAVKRNIDEIYFLEHTHIFKECRNLYNEMSVYNEYQKNWYQKKWEQARPLKDYIDYIEKLKQMYSFDFLVGSIHFIDGWAFSHMKQRWNKNDYDMDELYERYYALMLSLINSRLFSGLAINYGDKQLGMNADMLECMVKYNVPILTASDAHSPQNVGLYIKEMNDLIQCV
ncbi:MAG: PHP domain-containing protein [Lachnospiraceae bacterium]|nr:PHP domain-containing protein [Lachnospiraceae bacterium]